MTYLYISGKPWAILPIPIATLTAVFSQIQSRLMLATAPVAPRTRASADCHSADCPSLWGSGSFFWLGYHWNMHRPEEAMIF